MEKTIRLAVWQKAGPDFQKELNQEVDWLKAPRLCRIYSILDLALSLIFLGLGIYIIVFLSDGGDRNLARVLIFCGLFFLFSSVGFAISNFWIVLLSSLPVLIISAILGFMFIIGGWVVEPTQMLMIHTFVGGAIFCIIFQSIGIAAQYWARRSSEDDGGKE